MTEKTYYKPHEGGYHIPGLGIACFVLLIVFCVVVGVIQIVHMNMLSDNEGSAAVAASPYEVSIEDVSEATSYDGKPAIIVSYSFTNGSDEAAMFYSTIDSQALQNGTALGNAIVLSINTQSSYRAVEPGETIRCQKAFLLQDDSTVTLQCAEFSMDENVYLAEDTYTPTN